MERIKGLTTKQSLFLIEYARTDNLSQACRVADINRTTGYSYLEKEEFQETLSKMRSKIINSAWIKLSSSLDEAVQQLLDILNNPKTSVNARLRATELIFDYSSRYADKMEIIERMERLEDSLNAN